MSGGIWLLWNQSKINIKIIDSSRHFIHGIVNQGGIDAWLFIKNNALRELLGKKH